MNTPNLNAIRIIIQIVSLGLFLCSKPGKSQDFNFSQFNLNRTYFNPAFTGMDKGVLRGTSVYRKLWPNFPGDFSTKHFAIDHKTYNAYGMGLFVISNNEGEGFLGTHIFGGNYSWRGKINDVSGSFFQLGAKISYNVKEINYEKLIFSDELDEIYGEVYPSSFVSEKRRQQYWDFSVGALFHFPTIRRHRKVVTHTMGLALHHFTRPKDSFLESDTGMPMKLTLHSQSRVITTIYSLDKESRLYFKPSFLYEVRGESLFGAGSFNNFLYGVDVETDPLFGGVWYSSHVMSNSEKNYRALIFKFGVKIPSENKKLYFRLSYSYDMSISKVASSTQGSHEIGLRIDFLFPARYKYNIFSF